MRRRLAAIIALVLAAATLALAAIGAASLVVNQPMKMAGARTRAPSRGQRRQRYKRAFSPCIYTPVVRAVHGDASGVRAPPGYGDDHYALSERA